MDKLKEVCVNCGCTKGSHLGSPYYSEHYESFFPKDCCPGHEDQMDWDKGPGTIFKGKGDKEDATT